MARSTFQHLTYDEAQQMTRGELLERVVAEQQWWFRRMDAGRARFDDEGYREFCRIMHLLDPGEALADALRVVKGLPGPSYWDQRPIGADDE